MPASSVSDFEQFEQHIKEQIKTQIEHIEKETGEYVLEKENEADQKIEKWSKQVRLQWDQERNTLVQQNLTAVSDEASTLWSKFMKERKNALKKILEVRLSESFPVLAECFVSEISRKYKTGIFVMPEAYLPFVKKEGFIMNMSEENKIIFTKGNLYIEYSVERILEELDDEIITMMNVKGGTWQV